jgi:proteasome lid subunit RPN8/RPN11
MKTILKHIIEALYQHAEAEAPLEACGYLGGNDQAITMHLPMTNIDASQIHYSFDPAEQFQAMKGMRSQGLELLGVYHSHPESPARPSKEDIRLAYDPDLSYFIVSLQDNPGGINAFKIKDDQVIKEELIIID